MRTSPGIILTAWLISTAFMQSLPATAQSFSGNVRDAHTSLPLPGVEIKIGNGTVASAVTVYTDSAGSYVANGLPSATDYTIMASAPGFESANEVMLTLPSTVNFSLSRPDSGLLVATVNQGLVNYCFDGEYTYRVDGTVDSGESTFPNIDDDHPLIDSLMKDIGCGTNTTDVDSLAWNKCMTVWSWLTTHASYAPGSPTWQAAMNIMYSAGWPSMEMIARTYDTYGFIPWGTCMSRAQILTTILYRAGIPRDRGAIAETRWQFRYSQHMYSIVWLAHRWVYLDPIYISIAIPNYAQFHSVPLTGDLSDRDYCHPYNLNVIPGSVLTKVPEATNRPSNSPDVFIMSPSTRTHHCGDSILVIGATDNPQVEKVLLAGDIVPVSNGRFEATMLLAIGANPVVAQVSTGKVEYQDSLLVTREEMIQADYDGDGLIDWDDNCSSTYNPDQADCNSDGIGDACEQFICGDANSGGGDPAVDIDDAVFLINFVFGGGAAPCPPQAGDANCAGDPPIDIDDIVYLINYIFASGPVPCADCP